MLKRCRYPVDDLDRQQGLLSALRASNHFTPLALSQMITDQLLRTHFPQDL